MGIPSDPSEEAFFLGDVLTQLDVTGGEISDSEGSRCGIFTYIGIILNYIQGVNVGKYSSTMDPLG